MPESYPMNGGNGTYSYTQNSYYQKTGINVAKRMVSEAIGEKLDINNFSSGSNSFRIADLGCSVGPNTFTTMQNIVDAVQHKYQSQGLASKFAEFQVFFNDQDSNDFNTLFTSMPKERPYYAVGVPGSFYGRLFPESFVHFVNSSFALHWLSRVPEELLDKNSPAWNKGRIHYTNASDAVVDAYAAQFTKDMEGFLDARAKELVSGGMMVIITLGCPNGMPYAHLAAGIMFDCLESCLNDMAKGGLLSENQVDSFNLPVYAPSPKEKTELVERNGCFSIERLELTNWRTEADPRGDLRACVMHVRAGFESIIRKHFGNDIIDDLFERLLKEVKESFHLIQSSYMGGTQLSVILKRK
ncbi:PREDICTED: probable S-adenosylmethionine-dependent methyltransferase At5g38100 [Theobroma cacao]|uniref:Probable S-adenosylmethionine-dependent methyltransferase At5g38100 n=1 Tax=Theobroma cacao TaxID=3641 RepID=A0AB32VK99_THECC|nr:PREDICTED: probable S-adenosylmethionine-dependent methyltransferase At5g38100 [Theobroma cacao]